MNKNPRMTMSPKLKNIKEKKEISWTVIIINGGWIGYDFLSTNNSGYTRIRHVHGTANFR